MNYLAHAFLSFGEPEILVGNMISDFVKGKKKFDYPPGIRAGIQLHRYIDEYTDNHPVTGNIKQIFKSDYRLYSGAFADVAYDHFLANDSLQFPATELSAFSKWVYSTLDIYLSQLPPAFQHMFPHMKQYDWLYNYRLESGIANSFAGLARRALYIVESETAFKLFLQHYQEIQKNYEQFFPEVKNFAHSKMLELQQQNSQ